jgi:hypothetical protein
MNRPNYNRVCIAAATAALLFCSMLGLMAKGNEKPLLRVHESITSGFAMGTRDRFLEVSQNGQISLRKTFTALFSGKRTNEDGSKAMLNAAELLALRNFIDSKAVRELQAAYNDHNLSLSSDYHGSMQIEMTPSEETKRIVLPSLGFDGEENSKIYPVPIHDLVCKIYGLEVRVGIPYSRTVRLDANRHESDATWCDAASLDLIPKAAP